MSAPGTGSLATILAGHSHCTSLGVPLKTADGRSRIVPLEAADDRFVGFSGAWPRPPEFWTQLGAAARGRTVVLVWQGNEHYAEFLLSPGRRFDFQLREEPDLPLDPDADLVPDFAAEARMGHKIPLLEAAIDALRRGGAARVIVSGTPPPKGDAALVRAGALRESYYFGPLATKLGLTLEDIAFSPPLLMYKLWRVLQRQLEAAARRKGAEFVHAPPATQRDGFLLDSMAAGDATHANAAYGDAARDHLAAYLAGRPQPEIGER